MKEGRNQEQGIEEVVSRYNEGHEDFIDPTPC